MTKIRLDKELIKKICQKTGYSGKYVRERISKRANRLGISSEAVLVIWAKNLEFGTARYQRSLSPAIREEVRSTLLLDKNSSLNSVGNTFTKVKVVTRKENNLNKWYEKPLGIILIGVVVIIIGVLLTNFFGLTKP
jgi:hypothetical protein